MATIKAIEDRTIHQIQSGQVIVDICSVVKELVENSLDAGATTIDVRFRNQGLDAIEVQDNGAGISADNYATVALKDHTSKLSNYNDLTSLTTFGFRGEALSSLCALSNFTITTCTANDAPRGTKLEFEASGAFKRGNMVAAQKGTMVVVEELFHNLPVRRRELERNIKKEWGRVIAQLNQYACIQTCVKFSVTSQTGKGKRATMFSTKGNQTTRENIVNVFGAKTMTALIDMDLNLKLTPTSGPIQRWSAQEDGGTRLVRVVGHISRPAHGEGRQTPDRQMFYINARPCGLPQISKAFNEVYKSFNSSQSPFIFANIILDTHLYDVNVSPDKRTILLHDQSGMIDELKEKLSALFEGQDHTVPVSQLPVSRQTSFTQLTMLRQSSTLSTKSRMSLLNPAEEFNDEPTGHEIVGATSAAPTDSVNRDGATTDAVDLGLLDRHGSLTIPQMSQDRESGALLSKWLNLDDQRADNHENADGETNLTRKAGINVTDSDAISASKKRLIQKLAKDAQHETIDPGQAHQPLSNSYIESSAISSNRLPAEVPVAVRDFHARLAGLDTQSVVTNHATQPSRAASGHPVADAASMNSPESHAQTSATKPLTVKRLNNTNSLDVPAAKRARQTSSSNKSNKNPLLPTFGSKLSQRFLAGGQGEPSSGQSDGDAIRLVTSPGIGTFDNGNSDSEIESSPMSEPRDGSPDPSPPSETRPTGTKDPAGKILLTSEDDMDDEEKKAHENMKVQEMIRTAEESLESKNNTKRTSSFLKGGAKRKDATVNLEHTIGTSLASITTQMQAVQKATISLENIDATDGDDNSAIDSDAAEEKLSLKISKTDFAQMKIIGQFNLGFILASRSSAPDDSSKDAEWAEDIFIIDQHASDEKYNFERLQKTTVVQSQPLACPKVLDLTAVEEEIVAENQAVLTANGFNITFDDSGASPVGSRCSLLTLPLSKQTIFTLSDLEELISLLSENSTNDANATMVRPSKVRKMFAMRACRSSIMIGKTLSRGQMRRVVDHLGELDKPWNCPHGRPTMRHLCGLGTWTRHLWQEGDAVGEDEGRARIDWEGWVQGRLSA